MKRPVKHRGLKIFAVVLCSVLVIIISYLIYVFTSYYRVEDNAPLDIHTVGTAAEEISTGTSYSIITYNIGFCAYTQDFSFFMDGGKSSWAESEESVIDDADDIGNFLKGRDPDLYFLQEVDTDGTRSYHVNQFERIMDITGDGSYIFAQNFDSPFLFWPVYQPHGSNQSGIVTYTFAEPESSIRRSLPVSESVTRIVDLDRCYSITRIPADNGRELCLYNLHLSAYGSDASVREGQTSMLFADMEADYEAGNYVIVGGDFNHDLRDEDTSDFPAWAQNFPVEDLPAGFSLAFDVCEGECDLEADSCRDTEYAYDPGNTFTVLLDGFIVSDNVTVEYYENLDLDYVYSDHNPVYMEFSLIP